MEIRKACFRFWNGARFVWADPLRVERRLYAALGDPHAVFAASQSSEFVIASTALEQLVEAVRDVFRMEPFDDETGAGATEEDCRNALQALWDYLAKKKLSAAASPTS